MIDLDICVGCHACAVACKEWNDGGEFGPLPDEHAYAKDPLGVWFNRVHTYDIDAMESPSRCAGRAIREGSRPLPRLFAHKARSRWPTARKPAR